MTTSKKMLIIIVAFIWLLILGSLLDIVKISFNEIFSYTLVLLGMSIFYPSFIIKNDLGIFVGSICFLTGTILFISSRYDLYNTTALIIPASLLILAFSLLMIFIGDTSDRKFFYISLFIIVVGLLTFLDRGNPTLTSLTDSVLSVPKLFWPIALLVAASLIVLVLEKKE